MCTVIVLNDQVEGYPLVIVANRDERYDRPSRPPELVLYDGAKCLRPWDDEKEGTWIGVAQNGWLVTLTNQDDGKHDTGKQSRGKVVDACLKAGTHSACARILAHIDPNDYNPFNLVLGRPGAMMLVRVLPGEPVEMLPLDSSVNVVTNDCWGALYNNKWATTMLRMEAAVLKSDDHVRRLFAAVNEHSTSTDPFQSLCVHAEEHAFGTRSTSIITVSSNKDVEYWYSEGHPCQSNGLLLAGKLLHTE